MSDDAIKAAERAIAAILAELERVTGSYVDSVDITNIEVTQMEDTRPQVIRSVSIDVRRLPGTRWEQ